ncbi:hypothetical protein EGC79_11255 [Shewanella vesiculosa]|uniref:hypothetical protein n=1 Tax=Shewanella vesiculosa TaxID=518738 RepID=UPI000F4E3F69|nr:hypothetical protein [Shewanella vesiculosa]RPA50661.1 hypothetical protein EGC79_11255 [Shewanella vesiculosa]UJL44342.1 hypothetical protein KDH10_001833 [Shewanella vesiculosa]
MNIDWQAITKMPYWLARPGSELDKLRKGAVRFWQRLTEMLAFPSKQLDPMTAELAFVHLLAWERDIEQIPSETELMYRIRVKYALPFAKGAGSKTGWLDMFEKLGMPWVNIDERVSETDWDVVDLQLLDVDFGDRQNLINYICRQYGRTTRRYQYTTIAKMAVMSPPKNFDNHNDISMATVNTNLLPAKRLMMMDSESSFLVAKIKQL